MPLPQAAQIRAAARAAGQASKPQAPQGISFRVRSNDLKQLAKDFRQASNGKELRKAFTKQVRGSLRPIVPEVRAAYRAAPSQGHGSATRARQAQPDLRGLLAKATRIEVKLAGKQAGVRVRVDGRKMPAQMRRIPKYYEGTVARWKHPVFGRGTPANWVAQRPHPTFFPVVERHKAQVVAAVNRARDEVARKLERGTP